MNDTGYWRLSGKRDDLVIAVAIALRRAHSDSMSGGGVFDHYWRLAMGTATDRANDSGARATIRV